MKFNINNFINTSSQSSKIVDFQDLDHIDGVSISAVSAGLYKFKRDELVLFYFRDGANYASVYTQSKLISENLKWNKKIKSKKVFLLKKFVSEHLHLFSVSQLILRISLMIFSSMRHSLLDLLVHWHF